MIEETIIFVLIGLNLFIIKYFRVPILQIVMGLLCAVLAISFTDVIAFPFLNLLLLIVCIVQLVLSIREVK